MKTSKQKFIRLLLLGAIPMMAFSACIREREVGGGTVTEGESPVRFSVRLPGASHASRALSDDNESHVQTIDILMFEQGGGVWKYKAGVSGSAIATDGTDATKKTFTITMRHGDYDLVMLANARERIVALDLEGKTKSQVLAALAEDAPAGGKWIADASAAGYKPIPMWGEIGDITIDGSTEITEADDIILTRMVARVDVKIAPAVSNFTITSVDVYNYNMKGSLAPLPTAWNSSANPPRATAPNVPAGSTLTKGPLEYNNKDGKSEVNTTGNECTSEIYIFEAENHTGAGHTTGKDHLDRTCIVVGGVYGTDAEPTYYRADFSTGTGDGETFLDVLRNHHYTFTVTKVSGSGYATSEDAFQGSKKIEITVSVTDWGAENRFPLGWPEAEPTANSYIVAPGKSIWIPVFGQVQQAMDAGHLAADWITNDMNLGAYIVWCDNSDVNGVVNTTSLTLKKGSSSPYTQIGLTAGNKQGNAVIAVYQDKGNDGTCDTGTDEIKWSWHVWVCNENNMPKEVNGSMDRNLGALSTTWVSLGAVGDPVLGMYYQWGRKDPFPSTGQPAWPSSVFYQVSGDGLQNSLNNPTSYYNNWSGSNGDRSWHNGNATGSYKTVYDPCPKGWTIRNTIPANTSYTAAPWGVNMPGMGGFLPTSTYGWSLPTPFMTDNGIWLSYYYQQATKQGNVYYNMPYAAQRLASPYDIVAGPIWNSSSRSSSIISAMPVRCVRDL